jgi:hypothetical protein
MIAIAIVGLLFWSHPFGVSRLVITAISDSPDRCSFGARSNVREEVCEFLPALANRYSARAVVPVTGVFRITATAFHGRPRGICEHPFGIFCAGLVAFFYSFRSETAATGGPAPGKIAGENIFASTAIALTKPKNSSFSVFPGIRNNSQSTESVPAQIDSLDFTYSFVGGA